MAASKLSIIIPSVIIIALIALNVYGIYRTEYAKKPIVKEKVNSKDFNYLYKLYISSTPNLEGRQYYGNGNASIKIIAFADMSSENSKEFISKIFPALKQDFIDTGKARFYHKHYITADDYKEKSKTYLNAKELQCMNFIDKEKYYTFYFDIIAGNQDTGNLVNKHGIPKQLFYYCMEKQNFEELLEDMSETENFGIVGVNPRFYIGIGDNDYTVVDGIPPYSKFKRVIRQYQLILGD